MEHTFDTTKKEPPYGVRIDVVNGVVVRKYYDINKKFYDNTDEIEVLQIELKKIGEQQEFEAAKKANKTIK